MLTCMIATMINYLKRGYWVCLVWFGLRRATSVCVSVCLGRFKLAYRWQALVGHFSRGLQLLRSESVPRLRAQSTSRLCRGAGGGGRRRCCITTKPDDLLSERQQSDGDMLNLANNGCHYNCLFVCLILASKLSARFAWLNATTTTLINLKLLARLCSGVCVCDRWLID